MFGLFQKKQDPKEMVQKWRSQMRKERHRLERDSMTIKRQEAQTMKTIKGYAEKGDVANAKVIAKELVFQRQQRSRIAQNVANLMNLESSLTEQLAMVKVAGCLEKSTMVMNAMSSLVKTPEMMKQMAEMSQEMQKAGLIEEMMNDTIDEAFDNEDIEAETEAAVDQVLVEIAAELPNAASFLPTPAQPAPVQEKPQAQALES